MKKIYQVLITALTVLSTTFYSFSQVYNITAGLPTNIISGGGTIISGLTDDNFQGPFNIGFNFNFFNTNQTQFYMSSNGYISFGSGYSDTSVGTIPNTSTPNNFIAYAATDQNPGASSSPIINYFVSGTSPNRILVINYQNIRLYGNSSIITSVQLQLFEGSGKIEIHNIQNYSGGSIRTIGIENSTGTAGFAPAGMVNSTSINVSNTMIRFSSCSIPAVPIISPSSVSTLCASNPTASLTATCATGNLNWSNGSTSSVISVSPSQTTTYTATCSDNGCQSSSNIVVPVLQTPTISPNGTNYVCNGNTINLTASAGVSGASIQWYKDGNSILNATNSTLTVNSAGSYSVNISKDACSGVSAITEVLENSVTINPPIISPSSVFTCPSTTISLTATGCSGTVVWSNNSSGSVLNVSISTSGTYSAICQISGCGSSGVSNIASVNIATVSISAVGSTQICPSNTVLLQSTTNITSSFTYQWLLNGNIINGATSATYNAGSAGNYGLRITLPNNCMITSGVIPVTITSAIVPTISICGNSNIAFSSVWNKAFGGSSYDGLEDLVPTNDGGFILVGVSDSGISGDKTTPRAGTNTDAWIVKIDANRNKIWDKSFGGFDHETFRKIIPSNDGNFIIAGVQYKNNGINDQESSYWLLKIDGSGNIIWEKTYKGGVINKSYINMLREILILTDGYLLAGESNGNSNSQKSANSRGGTDFWVIKTDFSGNIIWEKTIGGNLNENLNSIIQTNDGGILVAGASESSTSADKSQNSNGESDYWIVKIDGSGNKVWDKSFGSSKSESIMKIIEASGGGFILGGKSDSNQGADKSQNSRGRQDFWLLKINDNGDKLWDVTLGGDDSDNLFDGISLDDGYIFVGSTYSNLSGEISRARIGSLDSWLTKVDLNGNKIWDRRLGSIGSDYLNSIFKINSGTILFGGGSGSADNDVANSNLNGDMWITMLSNCTQISIITVNTGNPLELTTSGCPGAITWNTGQTTNIINVSPTQNTNYSVSCISNNNCTTQANVQVNVNCSSTFAVTGAGNNQNPVVCTASPTIILEASGCSGNILWSNGATSSSISVSPNATGTFSATCSGTSCMPVTKTINVIYLANPTISTTNPTTVCIGQTVSLTASTNVTGGILQWFLDGNSIVGANSLVYSATATGSYSFKVSKDGCEAVSNIINITINTVIPPKPTLTASTAYVCGRGFPVTLTASGCNGTVNWYRNTTSNNSWVNNPVGTTASAYIYDKIKYYVSCTENSCTSIVSDTLLVDYARVNITAPDNLICNGGSVLLSAEVFPNTGIVSYQWQLGSTNILGETNSFYTATTAGTYNLIVSYNNGCSVGSFSNVGGKNITLNSVGNLPLPTIAVTDNSKMASPIKVWDRRFGTDSNDNLRTLLLSNDNSSLTLSGDFSSSNLNPHDDKSQTGRGLTDYWIIKVDTIGNKIWDRRFGTREHDVLRSTIRSNNNSYILIGYSLGGSGSDKTQMPYTDPSVSLIPDGWLVKVDESGNKVWDKQFGGNYSDILNDGLKFNDNEYIIAGETNSDITFDVSAAPKGFVDYWCLKIDASGNKIWDKRFGGSGSDYFKKIVSTSDGGFILVGESYSGVSGDKSEPSLVNGSTDLWLIKLNSSGNKVWDKTIGTTSIDFLSDIVITNSNDILVSSNTGNNSYLFKLNSSGSLIWQKTFLNSASFQKILPNQDGILIVGSSSLTTGVITSPSKGGADGFLLQLDSFGNKIWDKRFGGSSDDGFLQIIEKNNEYFAAGFSYSPISGDKTQPLRGTTYYDFWLVKLSQKEEIPQPASINAGQSINLIANNCPGTVTWSGGTTGTGAMVTVSPTSPTTYTASCSAYGCSTSSNITININCSSNFVAVAKDGNGVLFPNPTVCTESPSVLLEATGCLGTITWSNGATGSTTSVSPISNTTYTATCSDAGCTSVTSSVLVKIFEVPTITAVGNTTFCVGGSVVLNATVTGIGYTFQWYKDGSTINNQTNTITVNQSGSYQVLISKNGCSSISTATLVTVNSTVPAAPTYNSNTVYGCFNSTMQLVATGCNGGLISWSNGSTGSTISFLNQLTPNSSIIFTTTCTVGGCQSLPSVPLIVNLASSSVLNNSIEYTCNGSSATLFAATKANATYQWLSNGNVIVGATNTSYTTNQTGSYSLRTIYSPNCSVISSANSIQQIPTLTNVLASTPTSTNDTLFKVWDKVLGGTSGDYTSKMVQTFDNNYFLFGSSISPISGNKSSDPKGSGDYWLVKLDENGNKIWDKSYGGNGSEYGQQILKTNDNGYILLGGSGSGISGDKTESSLGGWDIWLIKIDENGNKIWDKTIGTVQQDEIHNAIIQPDGNMIIIGTRWNNSPFEESIQVIKVAPDGNVIWQKIFKGMNGYDSGYGITQTSDNGLLVTGYSTSTVGNDKTAPLKGGADYWVIKIDQLGNKVWDKTYGGSGSESAATIIKTNDNHYYLIGTSSSPISGDKTEGIIGSFNANDIWIVKIDESGNIIWDKRFGGDQTEQFVQGLLLQDNSLILACQTYSSNTGNISEPKLSNGNSYVEDIWTIKINSNGILIWEKRIGGDRRESPSGFYKLNEEDIIMICASNSNISFDKTFHSWNSSNCASNFGCEDDSWLLKIKLKNRILGSININQGQSINLVASNCQGNVAWSNGMTGASIVVSPSENTNYTATCNAFGCSTNSTIQVNVNPCSQAISLTQADNILTGTSAVPIKIKAVETINAINSIGNPPTNAVAKYAAGKSINLNVGFKVEVGSIFEAKISNTPCNE